MPGGDQEPVVDRIARIRRAYERAERDGSFEPVAPFVSEELVVMMPGQPPLEGRAEWASLFNDLMADAPDKDYEITYSSEETIVADDLALDRGTAIDTATDDAGGSTHGGYSYLWVYQHLPPGEWKLTHLIWNSTD